MPWVTALIPAETESDQTYAEVYKAAYAATHRILQLPLCIRLECKTHDHDCIYFLQHFCIFLQLMCIFSKPPPHFSPTFPILRGSERVLYSAHTYTLSGCTKVPTNRPIRAALQRRCCGVGALCTAKKGGRGRGVSSCLQRHEGGMRAV